MIRPAEYPVDAKKYAVLSYDTENLGDEIQSIAAAQFLPRVDEYINREYTNIYEPRDGVPRAMIMNGWFMHLPANWPPSGFIHPLFISFHLNVASVDKILCANGIEYLNEHGPIGARDLTTLEILQGRGVDSYFSGCLTLATPRPPVGRDESLVIVNDVPGEITSRIRSVSKKRVVEVDQNTKVKDPQKRFRLAYNILEEYARASFVVTSRLHCALPCLALGTPVVLIKDDSDPARFAGLESLLHSYTQEQFLDLDTNAIDFPRSNKRDHLVLRQGLIRRTESFIGHVDIRRISPFQRILRDDPQILQIVEAAYKSILRRTPDEDGFRTYAGLLARVGLSQGCEEMIEHLLLSQERRSLEAVAANRGETEAR